MSLTAIGFHRGMNLENEDVIMETAIATSYGQVCCVDKTAFTSDAIPRWYKMVPVADVLLANLNGVRTAFYGICNEPLGISAGGKGRFRFVGECPRALIATMAGIASLDTPLIANHGFANTTATQTATASQWRALFPIGTGLAGTTVAGITVHVGQKIIGMPILTASVNSASSTYLPINFDGIHGFGQFAI